VVLSLGEARILSGLEAIRRAELAGTAADDFVKKCTGAPANAAERKSAPKLQGMK
jgi:hypothetical protein